MRVMGVDRGSLHLQLAEIFVVSETFLAMLLFVVVAIVVSSLLEAAAVVAVVVSACNEMSWHVTAVSRLFVCLAKQTNKVFWLACHIFCHF